MQPQNTTQKNQSKQKIQQYQQQQQPSNYFKSFKQTLNKKYSSYTPQQLLQKLIQKQIQNKKLSTHLTTLQPYKQKHLREPNPIKLSRLFQQFQSHKFALKICYLGHLYDGMAMQNQTQNTIEGYLFKCLHTLNLIEKIYPVEDYTRAGRTDKGVSAMGNVVALKLRTKQRKKVVNGSVSNNNHHQINKQQNNPTSQKPPQLLLDVKLYSSIGYPYFILSARLCIIQCSILVHKKIIQIFFRKKQFIHLNDDTCYKNV